MGFHHPAAPPLPPPNKAHNFNSTFVTAPKVSLGTLIAGKRRSFTQLNQEQAVHKIMNVDEYEK
jgi:hypothetical protein